MQSTNVVAIDTNKNAIIENKLLYMRQLDDQIKALEAELKMIKEEVIKNYFVDHTEYKTAKGLVLATYISYKEKRFDSKTFEKDFPDIYENYKKENTVFKFHLKK